MKESLDINSNYIKYKTAFLNLWMIYSNHSISDLNTALHGQGLKALEKIVIKSILNLSDKGLELQHLTELFLPNETDPEVVMYGDNNLNSSTN